MKITGIRTSGPLALLLASLLATTGGQPLAALQAKGF